MNAVTPLRAADAAVDTVSQSSLRECVTRAVRRYLSDLDGKPGDGLCDLLRQEGEQPLLREVMAWYGGNQSKAAAVLGINRATLRKKLASYGML